VSEVALDRGARGRAAMAVAATASGLRHQEAWRCTGAAQVATPDVTRRVARGHEAGRRAGNPVDSKEGTDAQPSAGQCDHGSGAPTVDSTSLSPAALLYEPDLERAGIAVGSEVVSRDLETVGVVRRFVFDRETGALTGVVIHDEARFTQDLALPWTVIAKLQGGVVYLVLDTGELLGRR